MRDRLARANPKPIAGGNAMSDDGSPVTLSRSFDWRVSDSGGEYQFAATGKQGGTPISFGQRSGELVFAGGAFFVGGCRKSESVVVLPDARAASRRPVWAGRPCHPFEWEETDLSAR